MNHLEESECAAGGMLFEPRIIITEKKMKPDGYAVVTADGMFVGIWKDEESAKLIVNRSPTAKGERIVPMYFSAGMRLMEQVKEFHLVFGHPVIPHPEIAPIERQSLRLALIEEELDELVKATTSRNIVGIADALGDLAYVIAGMALEYGIPLNEVVNEIHRSNMSKLGADGKPIHREDGKALKGPNYTPPNIAHVLVTHGSSSNG
jgi:predicted HAD superfamily Cof-like phosphohydrolase